MTEDEIFLEQARQLVTRGDSEAQTTVIAKALKDAHLSGIGKGFKITTDQINGHKVEDFYEFMRALGRVDAEAVMCRALMPAQAQWLRRRLKRASMTVAAK